MQILHVESLQEAILRAKEIVCKVVDAQTVLFLSGGNTPKPLYEQLAKESTIHPIAAALIDERFGEKMHEQSNEKMIADTKLLQYFYARDITWYPILSRHSREGGNLSDTALQYDIKVRELLFYYRKSVGILGIGKDGHTAGIPSSKNVILSINEGSSQEDSSPELALSKVNVVQNDSLWKTSELVTSYIDTSGVYGSRITLTLTALRMLDTVIIIALGKEKKQALKEMFIKGSLEEFPARIYNTPEMSKKTILITDQVV